MAQAKKAPSRRAAPRSGGLEPRPAEQGGRPPQPPDLATLLQGRGKTPLVPSSEALGTPDPLDTAQAAEEEAVRVAMLRQHQRSEAAVAAALQRIRAGRYGICVDCEEPIPAQRLQAMPCAVRCRACQTQAESRGGR